MDEQSIIAGTIPFATDRCPRLARQQEALTELQSGRIRRQMEVTAMDASRRPCYGIERSHQGLTGAKNDHGETNSAGTPRGH